MFNKKGVDAVVATVLIIMITVAAVAIIWAFVIPMIKDTAGSATAEKVSLSIETAGGYTVWDSASEQAMVQVKRGIDGANLSAVKITFFSGKNSVYFLKAAPTSNSQATYKIPLWGFGKPTKVTIAPIFSKGEEGEVVSEITLLSSSASVLELTAGENITNYSSGKNFTVPISYNTHSCIRDYDENLEPDGKIFSCPAPTFCTVNDFSGTQGFIGWRCAEGRVGSRCTDDRDCLNLRCATTDNWANDIYLCVEGNNGNYCDSNSDCDSNICVTNQGAPFCSPGTDGELCDYNDDCLSNFCSSDRKVCVGGNDGDYCESGGDCKLGYCDRNNYQCTDGSVGRSCYYNEDCALGFCETYQSYTCTDGTNGQFCDSGSDCQSGFCVSVEEYNWDTICTSGLAGSYCNLNSDCASGFCNISSKCSSPSFLTGLTHFWDFSTGNAKEWKSGSVGSLQGNANVALGVLSLDGNGDYVSLSSNSNPTSPSNFTFSIWMKPVHNNSKALYVHSKGGGYTEGWRTYLSWPNSTHYTPAIQYGNGTTPQSVAYALKYGVKDNWVLYTVTFINKTSASHYLNGVFSDTDVLTTPVNYISSSSGWVIANGGGIPMFNGSLDNVMIWNRTLTATEISELYTQTKH